MIDANAPDFLLVMPGLVPGIHVLGAAQDQKRGWPRQAQP
jgi:hypothetical protein